MSQNVKSFFYDPKCKKPLYHLCFFDRQYLRIASRFSKIILRNTENAFYGFWPDFCAPARLTHMPTIIKKPNFLGIFADKDVATNY